MKRFRILNPDFDTRASILSMEIKETWEPSVRECWTRNQQMIRHGLLVEYGAHAHEQKLKNFVELGPLPFSVVSFHNTFFRQARNAFIVGAYYPSLTAVCALGERVLNHLILKLRDNFKSTREYPLVRSEKAFSNWKIAIDTLESWDVLLPNTVPLFRKLRGIRNRAIHFNLETERTTRATALSALQLFSSIVEEQFSASGNVPWYIPNGIGLFFVQKAFEKNPFVAQVVLPNCALVGPAHDIQKNVHGHWIAVDTATYPDRNVTDNEYIELFKKAQSAKSRGEVCVF